MAQTTQTSVAVDDFDLLSDDDIAEDWKEGEDSWKGCLAINDEKRNMIDFETIGEISDSSTAFICVSYDDDFVATVDEILVLG